MKDRVFISSVQKELEAERLALLALLTTDPFLKNHMDNKSADLPGSPSSSRKKPTAKRKGRKAHA